MYRSAIVQVLIRRQVVPSLCFDVTLWIHEATRNGCVSSVGTQPVLHPPHYDWAKYTRKTNTFQPIQRGSGGLMKPATVDLKAGQTVNFADSDQRLHISIPAAAVTTADVSGAGGALRLQVEQIAPASGGNAGGSGLVSFGTYLLQVVDAHGRLVAHGLRQPITVSIHYAKSESALDLTKVFATVGGPVPATIHFAPLPVGITTVKQVTAATTVQRATYDHAQQLLTIHPLISTPTSPVSFNTDSPLSVFGNPDPFNVDLNAGSLSAGVPIEVPAGPGGLTPPINLNYSSE
jgi:hypothetical protein